MHEDRKPGKTSRKQAAGVDETLDVQRHDHRGRGNHKKPQGVVPDDAQPRLIGSVHEFSPISIGFHTLAQAVLTRSMW